MTIVAQLRMLVLVAFRNLFAHWIKSTIVGAILAFGTLIVVTGTALTDSIERAMSQGITGSIGGHLQIYSSKAKDDLAIFGGMMMGAEDIGRIDDFSKLRKAVENVEGVKAIVPMGIDMATATSPGELEQALEAMRIAVRDDDPASLPILRAQIREILGQLEGELEKNAEIVKVTKEREEGLANVRHAQSDEFWAKFEEAPLEVLEFLDTKVAPQTEEGRMMYFRYVGTDLEEFPKHFDRFVVVEGEMVPPGRRGFMFNKNYHEKIVKNFVARNLDRIHDAVTKKEKEILGDAKLEARVRRMAKQYRRITYQLTPAEAKTLHAKLKEHLGEDGPLDELMKKFLTVDDSNIRERHAFFYEVIGPMIDMYAFDVGDTITLRAFTRSGFLKSVNVKIYGTFQFKGLEDSDVAGGHNLIDLVTFREMYGLMTAEKKEELAGIREEVGLQDVSADDAEAALFGGDAEVVEAVESTEGFDEFEGVDLATESERMAAMQTAAFSRQQLEEGLALNAAVVLDRPEEAAATKARLMKVFEEAGLEMKVVGWQSASGMIGNFVTFIKGTLYVAIAIIFTVALVIINLSMVMATMERVTEIGTMRAIGALRRTVLLMFLFETVTLGVLAGAIGAGVSALFVGWLGNVGIPAPVDELIFLFGGPRLYPDVAVFNLVLGFVIVFVVSLLSTMYPAYLATKIQPIMAMRAKE